MGVGRSSSGRQVSLAWFCFISSSLHGFSFVLERYESFLVVGFSSFCAFLLFSNAPTYLFYSAMEQLARPPSAGRGIS
eukprot:scaffold112177_cov55-Attheya_sp.AAC.4